MREPRKPKQSKTTLWFLTGKVDGVPVHERNWFRSINSKKLKGEARMRKLQNLSDSFGAKP